MDATPERDARAGEPHGRLRACTVASPQAGPLLHAPARSLAERGQHETTIRRTHDDVHRKTSFGVSINMVQVPSPPLTGRKALVAGIANEHSIAYGCAYAFRQLGAELAITYLNEKAKPYVEPLARALGASIFLPLDVSRAGELEAVFHAIRSKWGRLDILVHSIAFAPKDDLQGGLLHCSAEGFAKAMDISCH